jgi:hypothetical protein
MKFKDKAALDGYFQHPVHHAPGEWLIPLIQPIELDFEAESSSRRLRS